MFHVYDKLNRFTTGTSGDSFNETGITYDVMGNITALNRYQAGGLIDQLGYTFTNTSGNYTNQVQSKADASGSNTGLVNGTTNYSWDANGNLQSNANTVNTAQNKSFTYNLLNLPMVATTSTGTATYTYDATGNKLRKVAVINGTTTTTDYDNGLQYKNNSSTIDFIQTEEGKAVLNSAGTTYNYYYYLGDNLGNTRVTFDTETGSAVSLQRDDYYPFGYEINRSTTSPKNEYLYNKKELQEELGQYDYGARFYDPVIARWTTIDPFAEKYRAHSPYIYVLDNPIKSIDINGDTIGVASHTGFNSFYGNNTTAYDISVSGKVENDSSAPLSGSQMESNAGRVSGAVESHYTTFDNSDPNETVTSQATVNITAASASNPIVPGDDVFRIVDPNKVPDGFGGYMPQNTIGETKAGGNVSYISSTTFSETPATTGQFANTGKSESGGPTLERTSGHELGHLTGLDDVKPGASPKNLMRQTSGADAGTKITLAQLKEMKDNYDKGMLNNGHQNF